MPFINRSLIDAMIELVSKYQADVFVPINNGFYEPLCAIYSKNIVSTIEEQLKKNSFKISDIFLHINTFKIEEAFWRKFDPDGKTFININRIEDLKKVNGNYKNCSDKKIYQG